MRLQCVLVRLQTQHTLEAGDEILGVDRLGQQVRSAEIEGPPLHVVVGAAGENDDWHMLGSHVAGDVRQQCEAVAAGHVHVRHDSVERVCAHRGDGGVGAAREVHVPAGALGTQHAPQSIQHGRLVINK